MSKMIVSVFDDEETAYKGAQALAALHAEGSISVYAAAVVSRDKDGVVDVKEEGDEGPLGTALGMLTGAIVGIIGGPAGVLVGTAAGAMFGASFDLINMGVGIDFVDEVGSKLEPGKTAVVAEIEETWVTPLDTKMAELGAAVIRRYRTDVEDEQLDRDIAAAKADYQSLKQELAEAHESNKAAISAKVEAARERLSEMAQESEAQQQKAVAEAEAKIAALEEQIKNASDETRAKLEAKRDEVRERNAVRQEKLSAAWKLIKEALAA